VHDPRFWAEVAWGGSVGAGEAYMLGYWSADDLTALLRILAVNEDVMDGLEGGLALASAPLRRLLHWRARNTREGSRRNIAAHYDLGNAFFALFLDPTMMYSSALFERPGMTLEEASVAKLERVCRLLDLHPGDRVLEIGTGWGGFALHAASRHGCHVTTTTISAEQHSLAARRVHEAGLTDLVTLLRSDYRDLTGRYDKLVSIEMIEAIGHEQYETFFGRCAALLEDDGRMLLQAITIADRRYPSARDSVDFIKKHIFPGCCIPSVSALAAAMAAASDLRLVRLDDIGPHYATTLRCWRENLLANARRVRALGYPERFLRMWEFYLSYCEDGFAQGVLGDIQALFVKPHASL
jgi:cyclopropane-fatty-acyl-phospholipid synthase